MSEVVVVTGSSSGIGRAVAERFARDGARLIINSSRSVEAGEALACSLPEAVYVQADVSREEDAQRLIAAAVEQFGRLDVVVNNAGTTRRVPFHDVGGADDELWQRILAVNLMAVVPQPGGGSRFARRKRDDRQRRIGLRNHRWRELAPLRRLEGGAAPPDADARAGTRAGCPRERGCTRVGGDALDSRMGSERGDHRAHAPRSRGNAA